MKPVKKNKSYAWLWQRHHDRKKIVLFIACLALTLLFSSVLKAQDTTGRKILSLPQVLEIVKRNHPVAKLAAIRIDKSGADITIARGAFDPLFYNSAAQKTFSGTEYYNYNRPELTIPTWFGVEINTGLEYLSGSRTDPQETAGKSSYFGISVPLAKNLLMDKRRAALQTAKIYRTAAETEQRAMLNDLLQETTVAYWNWVLHYQDYQILQEAVQVNERRLSFVRTSFRLGDRPAIDTTEALAQLQSMELMLGEASLAFRNAGLELSVFLWTDQQLPYQLPDDVIPAIVLREMAIQQLPVPALDSLLQSARNLHPELGLYRYKLDVLQLEKKLKFQELLPAVNFRYNQLGKGYDVLKTATGPLFENNYRYGLSVGLPLRFSAGRGEYKKAKLKITETKIERDYKQLQLETKVKTYYNELQTLRKQVLLQESAVGNYQALQQGEETRFRNGESSLFLVNTRENKKLEALMKLTGLKAKYIKTANSLSWAAGLLR